MCRVVAFLSHFQAINVCIKLGINAFCFDRDFAEELNHRLSCKYEDSLILFYFKASQQARGDGIEPLG